MNARSHVINISADGGQIEEAVSAIFHTLLFHRTVGKFSYERDTSYAIGTVGIEDVDCELIDFSYVRVNSPQLETVVRRDVSSFQEALRSSDDVCGLISLEFFQRKPRLWPLQPECTPWEIWTVKVTRVQLPNEHERQLFREKLGDVLTEKVLGIVDVLNCHGQYVPKADRESELETVYDTSLPDVQPFLFKISYQAGESSSASVSTTVKKLLRDTLSL